MGVNNMDLCLLGGGGCTQSYPSFDRGFNADLMMGEMKPKLQGVCVVCVDLDPIL